MGPIHSSKNVGKEMRSSSMTRILAGLTTSLIFLGVWSLPAQAAGSVTSLAKETRSEILTLTASYTDRYGTKLSLSQEKRLEKMNRETKRNLDNLVRLVSRAEKSSHTKDWRRAETEYEQIRSRFPKSPRKNAAPVFKVMDSLGREIARRANS